MKGLRFNVGERSIASVLELACSAVFCPNNDADIR